MKALAIGLALGMIATSANATSCRTNAMGNTVCTGSDGSTTTARTNPITGRTTITSSEGTTWRGNSGATGTATYNGSDGSTFRARPNIMGNGTTVTDSSGRTTNCRRSLSGLSVTCN
jgi:hypothetical protein